MLWLTRRRQQQAAAVVSTPDDEAADTSTAPQRRLIGLVSESVADSSVAVVGVLERILGEGFEIERLELANLKGPEAAASLQGGGCYVFVVEVESDGEAPAARPLTRSLRSMRLTEAGSLEGTRVAVLSLAHSVCAFSAAQGGSDKFRGGARLQSGLVDAGARALLALGTAEVEVEEVDTAVVPWAEELRAALLREEEAAKGLERMMRETEGQLRRSR